MVAKLIERGDVEFQPAWLPAARYSQIAAACRRLGMERLKPLKEALPPEVPSTLVAQPLLAVNPLCLHSRLRTS
jgi:hypothetical protein